VCATQRIPLKLIWGSCPHSFRDMRFAIKGKRGEVAMLQFPCQKDPVVAFLQSKFDADIVKIPEERIQPLSVMAGVLNQAVYLGTLRDCLAQPVAALLSPAPSVSTVAPLSGQRTRDVDVGLGLNILGGILEGFGLPSAAIQAQFQKASKIAFTFDDVKRRYFDPTWIGENLAHAQLAKNPLTSIFFGAPDPDAYPQGLLSDTPDSYPFLVVDSVIVSDAFSVSVDQAANTEFQLDIPMIEQVVAKANASLQVSGTNTNTVSFKGSTALTFAFTCLQFALDNTGGILTIRPAPSTFVVGAPPPPAAPDDAAPDEGEGPDQITTAPSHYRLSPTWSMIAVDHATSNAR
jgi:hypothetical protein